MDAAPPDTQTAASAPQGATAEGAAGTTSVMSPPPADPNPNAARPSVAFEENEAIPPEEEGPYRDRAVQTERMSGGYALFRGSLPNFPLLMSVWLPMLVGLNGISYITVWRVAWITSDEAVAGPELDPDPPLTITVFGAYIFVAFIFTYCITMPAFIHLATEAPAEIGYGEQRRRKVALVSLFHFVAVCLPLTIIEGKLLFVEGREISAKRNPNIVSWLISTLSVAFSFYTGILMLWWGYISFAVGYLRRRVAAVANDYVRACGFRRRPARRPGLTLPPVLRFISAARAANRFRQAVRRPARPPSSVMANVGSPPPMRPAQSQSNAPNPNGEPPVDATPETRTTQAAAHANAGAPVTPPVETPESRPPRAAEPPTAAAQTNVSAP